jgi:RNA recognition motif-containing protein
MSNTDNTVANFLGLECDGTWEDLAVEIKKKEKMEGPSKSQRRRVAEKAKKAAAKAAEAKEWSTVEKDIKRKKTEAPTPTPASPLRPVAPPKTEEKKVFVNTTLILKGLPYTETWTDELMAIFERYGELRFINVLRDEDKNCKGVAFIRFYTRDGSDRALSDLAHFEYNGRHVRVEYSRDMRELK